MLKIYIIGSNRFNDLKKELTKQLEKQVGIAVLTVGFSPVFDYPLKKKDIKTLHALENRSIEESDIVLLVDGDQIGGERHIGKDTYRELAYSRMLGKTVWTSDVLFKNYLGLMGQL